VSRHKVSAFIIAVCLFTPIAALAKLTIPSIFSDHMVLQADSDLPIWGRAESGAEVTVTLADQTLSTTTDASGKWNVMLSPLPASAKPVEMTIATSKNDKLTIHDILVGEVWLGSGQSNMAMGLKRTNDAEKYIKEANHPQIRLFTVKRNPTSRPAQDVEGKWEICSPQTVDNFSAVLYHFGRNLHEELKVPVGLIHSSWGGTPIRSWMPREAFSREEFDAVKQKVEQSARARAKIATRPAAPTTAPSQGEPTVLYNGMIAPLVPYALRGVTWYQGEANVGDEKYLDHMAAMVRIWRAKWSAGDFPFLFVQIAPYGKYKNQPDALPLMWEMQTKALTTISNSGMAGTSDIGNLADIHPTHKAEVGKRLPSSPGQHLQEKRRLPGPHVRFHKIDADKIRIKFSGVGSGLASRDAKDLSNFELAGTDGKFHPASAKIESDEVVLTSDDVPNPTSARFAWSQTAQPNLMNKEGLPAIPFRTRN
jgi:sialate O-acetylesterase